MLDSGIFYFEIMFVEALEANKSFCRRLGFPRQDHPVAKKI